MNIGQWGHTFRSQKTYIAVWQAIFSSTKFWRESVACTFQNADWMVGCANKISAAPLHPAIGYVLSQVCPWAGIQEYTDFFYKQLLYKPGSTQQDKNLRNSSTG